MMARYPTFDEIEALREDWERTFGEPMPWGSEINEPQVPMMRRCIRERSQEPLRRYVESLPPGVVY